MRTTKSKHTKGALEPKDLKTVCKKNQDQLATKECRSNGFNSKRTGNASICRCRLGEGRCRWLGNVPSAALEAATSFEEILNRRTDGKTTANVLKQSLSPWFIRSNGIAKVLASKVNIS